MVLIFNAEIQFQLGKLFWKIYLAIVFLPQSSINELSFLNFIPANGFKILIAKYFETE